VSQSTTNKEGLTFEEWVCAAGAAIIDNDVVTPYTTSWTSHHAAPNPHPGTVLLLCDTSHLPPGTVRRGSTKHYREKVRRAWKDGIDPTEWRA
jgi:hypothetical protein